MFLACSDRSRWRTYVLLSFVECNICLACSKSYKWKKSLHRHVRESPECWPILLTSGNGEFIRQIQYKMLYNTKNWIDWSVCNRLLLTKILTQNCYIWNIFYKNKSYFIVARLYHCCTLFFVCEHMKKDKSPFVNEMIFLLLFFFPQVLLTFHEEIIS